ncbi:RNA polymerase sigma factor [Clostridium oryzae]|uniref:ECF RNA polymerase sigma factor SigW n=1 Tax=Clostridium oryzae TaxID=1450648 RepID=A0A1V4INS8_9CLOT|nr:RNA polymerase sigma factor [Clostridium oryzae]OPJ61445.1 ECF RNA polymerase sigma factor SigW [Clostridium oryzae]
MEVDAILIRKMKNGDSAAVDKFVRKYYEDIYSYCYRKLINKVMAEDVAQETFIRFFEAFEQYVHKGKVKNYLYVIAGNLCKNCFKRKVPEALDMVKQEICLEESFEEVDTHISIEQALDMLAEDQREVILLHYYQSLKLREVAEILDISLSLVKYRLKQGTVNLKKMLRREDFCL